MAEPIKNHHPVF